LDGLTGDGHAVVGRDLGQDVVAGRRVLDKAGHQNQEQQRPGELGFPLHYAGLPGELIGLRRE